MLVALATLSLAILSPDMSYSFYSGVSLYLQKGKTSTSHKQARAGMKTRIGAGGISIWLAECSQSSCGSNTKNNSNNLLVLPATQANQLCS